jgi:hypothetical protein
MLLSFFTEEAYDELLNNIAENSEKYFQDDEWLADFFGRADYFKQSKTVEVLYFKPEYSNDNKTDEQKSQEDLVNTRLIFDAFKKLTPLQASNKYMWTYLCHAMPEYRKYIRNRWTDLRENTVETRFFVTTTRRSLLRDNALSRLWWFGYLTYDKESANPYALTEVLLTNQTICTDFMNTFNCRNVNRSRGVLNAIKDFKDVVSEKESIIDYFRECNKYLNRYAAVTNLDFLESNEIKKIALDYMVEFRNKAIAEKA